MGSSAKRTSAGSEKKHLGAGAISKAMLQAGTASLDEARWESEVHRSVPMPHHSEVILSNMWQI